MVRYIAIDGKSGSGKTHLSVALGKILEATVLHLDDYGNDFEPFVGIPALIDDLDSNSDLIIFEGVGVFDDRFERFDAFRVFADTDEATRILRVAKRDTPRADRSTSDWERIGKIWEKAEKEYFSEHRREKADIIVDTINTDSDIHAIVDAFRKHLQD